MKADIDGHADELHRIIGERQPISIGDLWAIGRSVMGDAWDDDIASEAFDLLHDEGRIEEDRSEHWWVT